MLIKIMGLHQSAYLLGWISYGYIIGIFVINSQLLLITLDCCTDDRSISNY